MMETLLSDIARLVEGKIIGDPNLRIHGINSVDEAKEGELTFLTSPQYYKKALSTQSSAILCEKVIKDVKKTFLLVENPRYAMARVLYFFHPPRQALPGVDPRASIGQNVILGKEVFIGPYVVIDDHVKIGNRVRLSPGVFVGSESEIGDDSLLYPNVTLYERVRIGKRVIIHSGSVIGADGFGFTPYQSKHVKVPQVGTVTIEEDVELGANVTVDRATVGQTVIGCGTKIDNQVHIGHNVKIGPHTLIVAQVGISGSVTIGHHVTLAGQVGVVDHVQIGDNAVVGARSVVTKDVKAHEKVSGFPALPHRRWLLAQASFPSLPTLRDAVKDLDRKIKRLEKKLMERT